MERKILTPARWDKFVTRHEFGHPFQLSAWGELKATVGWEAHCLGYSQNKQLVAGAQVLFFPLPGIGRKLAYIPRGPVLDPEAVNAGEVLQDLGEFAREQGAIYLKIEPAWRSDKKLESPWRKSRESILSSHTLITDLRVQSEDELESSFTKKARYSARRAVRNGIQTKLADTKADLDAVWRIHKETAHRSGFSLHTRKYYEDCYRLLGDHNRVLIAYREKRPIAFLWMAHTDGVGVYLYGGSNNEGRTHFANYLLQLEVIRDYYRAGVLIYDLNGTVTGGVTSFKANFATESVDWIGAYDLPLRQLSYQVWSTAYPALKPLARSLKKARERAKPIRRQRAIS